MTLAERIRQVREEKNMTQKAVAALMGISQQAYGQYESGSRVPKPETLGRIAAALDSTLIDITRDTDVITEENSSSYIHDFVNGTWNQLISENAVLEKYANMNPELKSLLTAFDRLNDDGQTVAVDRVEELAQIPKYQRAQSTPQDAPAGPDDKEPAEK